MKRWGCTICVAILLFAVGCGAPAGRYDAHEYFPDEPIAVTKPRPASVLIGGEGLDGLAMQIGREDWPSSFRDEFHGERGAYHEFFYDVQTSWPWGGFGNNGDYVWREFRSDRVGSFNR